MGKIFFIGMLGIGILFGCSVALAAEEFYVIPLMKKGFAPVAQTGQSVSQAVGDDGELQEGVRLPTPRFRMNGDGTVRDNLTGLVWLQEANCKNFFLGDNSGFNQRTWIDALQAARLLQDGYCGLSDGSSAGDWRLPNINELKSLIHYGYSNPAVSNTTGDSRWTEGDPFLGVQSMFHWTATTPAFNSNAAVGIFLYSGDTDMPAKTEMHYFWPVRNGG